MPVAGAPAAESWPAEAAVRCLGWPTGMVCPLGPGSPSGAIWGFQLPKVTRRFSFSCDVLDLGVVHR